jgi:N-sulfoglucosamine sulfohydrolase
MSSSPYTTKGALSSLIAGVLFITMATQADESAAAVPNIVVFLADDLGYLDSSPYGSDDVRTPNLRRFADGGCKFTHVFVASPSCAPSRAALLTGLMPARNGAEANHTRPLPNTKKLPAFLKELGYETAAFGKVAHYRHGDLYGFDTIDERRPSAEAVKEFVGKRSAKQPLCLFVGTHDPHVPWPENDGYDSATLEPPATHVDTPLTRAYRAQYYTAVSRADSWLGEVFDLTREKLGPNTLFVFTSDHGAQWPFAKWNLYDAGIRVPFLAVWPGVIKPGSSCDAMISWVDILPTLIEIGGGDAPRGLDGRSFAAILRGEKDAHRDRIFATHTNDGNMNVYPCRCMRTPNWKYILNLHPEWEHSTHINLAKPRDGVGYWTTWVQQAKTDPAAAAIVKRYHQRPGEELYDLTADPHELHNLADDPRYAQRLAQMSADLGRWMQDQGDTQKVFGTPRAIGESVRGAER